MDEKAGSGTGREGDRGADGPGGPGAPVDPFEPPGVTWRRVSPRLVTSQRTVNTLTSAPLVLVLLALALWLTWWIALGALAVAALWAWGWWLSGRQVPAWGYAERDDDLLVRHGLFFRTLVVVPYGRLQYVDVEAGPVDRRFGLAKVQLHTASPDSDAAIPGLPPEEAARLRDRLAERGQARLAGL
ncbi:PH domain-containing protein [Kineococcus sp. SYSU DK005]|uniref:PH domain-containing protein n=1 Tax=Kineococcus sp. SYSU DK005 TaxID=3383126 RepID=UPI003D7DFCC5